MINSSLFVFEVSGNNYPELLAKTVQYIKDYIKLDIPAEDIISDVQISTRPSVETFGADGLAFLKADVTYRPHWSITNALLGIKS
jgi:hypothetical protein